MDIKEMCIYAAFFGTLLVFRRVVHKQSPSTLGFMPSSEGWKLFGSGAFAGLIYAAGYFLAVVASGKGRVIFSGISSAAPTLRLALVVFLGHLPELLFGEALFRGYVLERLSLRLKPTASVAITSALYTTYSLLLSIPGFMALIVFFFSNPMLNGAGEWFAHARPG